MDNQNNGWNQNNNNWNTGSHWNANGPVPGMGMQQPPKKKGPGMGVGILLGVCLALLLGWAGVNIGCLVTNTQIVFVDRGASNAVTAQTGSSVLDEDAVSKINELAAYADLYYYDDIDREDLQDGLYSGLLEGLGDRYSVYYNAEEYEALQVSTTGQYYGIGAGLTQDTDTMVVSVTRVYEGTPSEEAGVKQDDVIVSVDGIDATSMEVTELVKLIRGEEGTTVHLEIYRPSTDEEISLDVERRDITLPSVEAEMLENNIGYIRIDSFETETAHQFETYLEELQAQGMEALVLDVRYNPGGMVNSVVQILDDILPEGLLVYIEDKNGNREEFTSSGDTYIDCPIAVLINGSSASASEILAGAIKDYEYGTLIGTTTYGKGIVQTIFPLEDGDAVKLTTAKYFTPNGNYIHEVGIDPDIELEYEYLKEDAEEYEMQYDNQIQKAIEVLTEELGN